MSTTPPQFGTAEYKSATSSQTCSTCKQAIGGEYYRVNGAQTCAACAEKVKQRIPKDSHSAFMRGMLFGVGGAIAGLIVYAAFGIITGLMIGYVSLAVGWLVGKAIKAGSKGLGGRRYQIAAVLLTYAAVSLAAVPIWISGFMKEEATTTTAKQAQASTPQSGSAAQDNSQAGGSSNAQDAKDNVVEIEKPGIGKIAGTLLMLGLASPFLKLQNGFSGIIGLVILYIGLQIAWKLTAGTTVDVLGPFKANEPTTS